jgi:hypothetical protein
VLAETIMQHPHSRRVSVYLNPSLDYEMQYYSKFSRTHYRLTCTEDLELRIQMKPYRRSSVWSVGKKKKKKKKRVTETVTLNTWQMLVHLVNASLGEKESEVPTTNVLQKVSRLLSVSPARVCTPRYIYMDPTDATPSENSSVGTILFVHDHLVSITPPSSSSSSSSSSIGLSSSMTTLSLHRREKSDGDHSTRTTEDSVEYVVGRRGTVYTPTTEMD